MSNIEGSDVRDFTVDICSLIQVFKLSAESIDFCLSCPFGSLAPTEENLLLSPTFIYNTEGLNRRERRGSNLNVQ